GCRAPRAVAGPARQADRSRARIIGPHARASANRMVRTIGGLRRASARSVRTIRWFSRGWEELLGVQKKRGGACSGHRLDRESHRVTRLWFYLRRFTAVASFGRPTFALTVGGPGRRTNCLQPATIRGQCQEVSPFPRLLHLR